MKSVIGLVLAGVITCGLFLGMSLAQDTVENPFVEREVSRDEAHKREAEREELVAHVNEIRAEIKRAQVQFEQAQSEGNEDRILELKNLSKELHRELHEAERALVARGGPPQGVDKKAEDVNAHSNALHRELGRLKVHLSEARKQGNEEKVRELERHIDELHARIKHPEDVRHADGKRHDDRDREHPDELEHAAKAIHEELAELEKALHEAAEQGQQERAEEIRRHMKSLFAKLEHIEHGLHRREHGSSDQHAREWQDLQHVRQVLVDQLRQNERRIFELRKSGNNEEALRELAQHQEKLSLKLREVEETLAGNPRHGRENHREAAEQMEHLRIAIEHLKAGGFDELVGHAEEVAEHVERALRGEGHDHHHDEHVEVHEHHDLARDELFHRVRKLETHLHQVQEELERVKHELERRNR